MRSFLLGAIIVFTVGLCAVVQAQTTYEHDIAFESLIGADTIRYAIGSRVPLQAQFINSGTGDIDTTRLQVTLYDYAGNTIHANTIIIDSHWQSGTSLDTVIGYWYPTTPGIYYARYCTLLNSDEYQDNDCSAQHAQTILTMIDSSIAAGSPDRDPHQPLMDKSYTIGEPVPVEIPFANLGASKMSDVPLRAIINSSAGEVAYDRSVLAVLDPGTTSTVQFPDFIPGMAGTYCIKAWSNYTSDNVPENDTITWCFTVMESTAGVSAPSAAILHLYVMPNPVSLSATIEYTTAGDRAIRLVVNDAEGHTVRTVPITSDSDSGALHLDMTSLPSGAYNLLLVTAGGTSVSARMMVQK
jgi:hypothetical protein